MKNQQPSQNQDEFEKLRLKNDELKKSLEREQVLHGLLYKEWKDLDEKREAKELELAHPKSRNLFYKYAFYVILILLIPGFFFWNAQKNKDAISAPSNAVIVLKTDSATIKDSMQANSSVVPKGDPASKLNKAVTKNLPLIQQHPTIQPTVEKAQEKNIIQAEQSKIEKTAENKPENEIPLDDSIRENIYWMGWNDYYNKSASHFKKSSQKYQAWLAGYNDGRNDAKKLLSKDSLQNKR